MDTEAGNFGQGLPDGEELKTKVAVLPNEEGSEVEDLPRPPRS